MIGPDSVLDLIDSAIADSTSPDAMRWSPDAPKAQQEQLSAAFETLARQATEQWAAIAPVMAGVFKQIVENVTAASLALQKLGFAIQFRPGARSCPHRSLYEACDFCYPKPFPAARDYRRRTKHRNRRRKT